MSFTKTISTVAALASIFGAAAAGWKLAESNSPQPPTALDEKINQLDQKLDQLSKPPQLSTQEIPQYQNLQQPSQSDTITQPTPPPPPSDTQN